MLESSPAVRPLPWSQSRGHSDPFRGTSARHLPERGVLAANAWHVAAPELIKPDALRVFGYRIPSPATEFSKVLSRRRSHSGIKLLASCDLALLAGNFGIEVSLVDPELGDYLLVDHRVDTFVLHDGANRELGRYRMNELSNENDVERCGECTRDGNAAAR
jgi:hypothetical protein